MDEFNPMRSEDYSSAEPRGQAGLAWIVIIILVAIAIVLPRLPDGSAEEAAADGGVMMEVQAKVLVAGAADARGGVRRFYVRQAEALNTGAVGQRQRAIILFAELGGPDAAAEHVAELDELLRQHVGPSTGGPIELREEQRRVQELLRLLYAEELRQPPTADWQTIERPRLELLDQADRDLLVAELGWFGELALVPREGPDRGARREFLRGPMTVLIVVSLFMVALMMTGLAGTVGLVVLLVFALRGRLGRGLSTGGSHHGIYAETFAAWLGLFLGCQLVAGAIGTQVPEHALLLMFFAFFASLGALGWPVLRGVEWRVVRKDIGLELRNPFAEGAIGIGGYAMALPLFVVGVLIVLILAAVHALVQQTVGDPSHPLAPEGVPAHPVFEMVAGRDVWPKIQLVLVAVIAAPIVEEVMFRGVFYRHLRDGMRRTGLAVSILGAAIVSAFVFAIVHPVPWFAYPALMALAIGFALAREWRSSILPSIVMHGIHNGVVIGLILSILAA